MEDILALTACPEEIETAFQECSQPSVSFCTDGYKFMTEFKNGRQSLWKPQTVLI